MSLSPSQYTGANGTITDGSKIPLEYTCSGVGKNPAVSWNGIPNGTKSLVFILDDPDAPAGTFTHWILYNIPPTTDLIPEHYSNTPPDLGILVGINSGNENDYFPPCPPSGQEHHYLFSLYALNITDLGDNLDRKNIDSVMGGHIIDLAAISAGFKKLS